MERSVVEKNVLDCINQIASEQSITLKRIEFHHTVVDDLGFKSLDVATLTALLESKFSVDPFSSGFAVITEIRTVGDICNLYDRCVNGKAFQAAPVETDEYESARMQKRLAKKTA